MTQFELTKKQTEFIWAKAQFAAYIAAIGTGKSTAMIVKALLHSQETPGNLGVLVRKNFTDLRDSTIKDFLDYTAGIGVKYSESNKEATLPNGSKILFRHGDELPVIKNLNLGFFGIEQAEEFSDATTWHFLQMRLRRKCEHRTGFIVGNTAGHNWIWQLFKRHGCPENHVLLEAKTEEHAHILPPDYIKNLKATQPEKFFRRYVENSWDVTEGLVYDEFDEGKHLTEPIDIPVYWERGFVLDHGFTNPTAVLWYAIDHDGNIWLYDEHYKAGETPSTHAKSIVERKLLQGWCDPAIFAKTQSRNGELFSIADEYREHGVNLQPALKASEASAIARVNEFFKSGRIKVFRNLNNFRDEINNWKYKEPSAQSRDKNLPEAPEDRNNHLMDCLKYLVQSRFPASVKPSSRVNHHLIPPVEADEMAYKEKYG